MEWQPGTRLNQYEIDRVLGRGGFGITYKATHLSLGQKVVIKTINDTLQKDPEYDSYLKRFRKEARTLAKLGELRHPHIVRVSDLFDAPLDGMQLPCLVMDFIDGEDLFTRIRNTKAPMSEPEALKYIQQVGDALHLVHRAGLVHRDTHPGNIMICNKSAILIDFGLAGSVIPTIMSSKVGGNPAFVPHDQLRGNRHPNVDIYSLGMSLYFALVADIPDPFTEPKATNPAISDRTNAAIVKAIHQNPKERPQSIKDWFDWLGLNISSQALQPLVKVPEPKPHPKQPPLADPPEPLPIKTPETRRVAPPLPDPPEPKPPRKPIHPQAPRKGIPRSVMVLGGIVATFSAIAGLYTPFRQPPEPPEEEPPAETTAAVVVENNPSPQPNPIDEGGNSSSVQNSTPSEYSSSNSTNGTSNDAEDADTYFDRGLDAEKGENYQEALTNYDKAIELNPNFAEAYMGRGLAKSDLGDKQGAIVDYTESIRLNNPDLHLPYNGRGAVKFALGDKQGAIVDYNKAIELNPNFAEAYMGRGLAKYNLGDKQGAIVDYNKAIELNPNFAEAYNNRGLAKYNLGDNQGAIVDYNKAIELNPNFANPYMGRGNVKKDLGDKQGAIVDYNKAIELNPNFADAYYNRGNSYQQLGEKQRALEDFREASRLYQQQGNTTWYQNANDRIRELGG